MLLTDVAPLPLASTGARRRVSATVLRWLGRSSAATIAVLLLPGVMTLHGGPGASVHGQQPSFGPLTWEEGSPLQRVAFTPVSEGAGLLEPGRWSAELYNGFSNIFEQDSASTHVLFLDLERLTTAVTVRYGLAPRWEVGGRLALESTGGGFLDGVIHDWHELWGFGQANRDRFPQDGYRQLLTDGEGRVYLDRPSGTLEAKDIRAFAKWGAWRSADGRSRLAFRGVLRAPFVEPGGGNDRVDGALAALWRQGMGDWYLHAMAGVSHTPAQAALEPVLRSRTASLTVAVERSLGNRVAALAQLQLQTARLRSFGHREVDRGPTNLLLGFAGRLGGGWSWNASFQEDIPADTPAVDFTATLTVRRSW